MNPACKSSNKKKRAMPPKAPPKKSSDNDRNEIEALKAKIVSLEKQLNESQKRETQLMKKIVSQQNDYNKLQKEHKMIKQKNSKWSMYGGDRKNKKVNKKENHTKAPDMVFLKTEQITIYESDYNSLKPKKMIFDTIIAFAFNYFKNDTFKHAAKNLLLFVEPSIVNSIRHTQEKEFLINLIDGDAFQSHKYIFFPINDSRSGQDRGRHWSLLIYQRHNNAFYHLDSIQIGDGNVKYAQLFAKKIYSFIRPKKDNVKYTFNKVRDAPKQDNNYDCGLYVIELCLCLAQFYTNGQHPNACISEFDFGLSPIDSECILNARDEWQKRINYMKHSKQTVKSAPAPSVSLNDKIEATPMENNCVEAVGEEDDVWNAYIKKVGNKPSHPTKLHSFCKGSPGFSSLTFKQVIDIFNANKENS